MDMAWCMAIVFMFFIVFLMDVFGVLNISYSCVMVGMFVVAFAPTLTRINGTTFHHNLQM